MRVFLAFLFASVAAAFTQQTTTRTTTELSAINRRDVFAGIAAAIVTVPQVAIAESHANQNRAGSHTHGSTFFFDDQIENVYEESQQATGDKLDINGAVVVRFFVSRTFCNTQNIFI